MNVVVRYAVAISFWGLLPGQVAFLAAIAGLAPTVIGLIGILAEVFWFLAWLALRVVDRGLDDWRLTIGASGFRLWRADGEAPW